MPAPVLFFLGYSLVLGTVEIAKTAKKPTTKNLLRDVARFSKTK